MSLEPFVLGGTLVGIASGLWTLRSIRKQAGRPSRLGRLLCRLGFHRQRLAPGSAEGARAVYDCSRPGCPTHFNSLGERLT